MRRRTTTALVTALALCASSATALAEPVEESAELAATEATFTYDKDDYEYRDMWLTISRGGEVVYDKRVNLGSCKEPFCKPGGFDDRPSVKVVHLDGDGEPEVLLDVFTGGAHCCFATELLRWEATGYASSEHNWGDAGYRVKDLDSDGIPELRSADARFGYRFTFFGASAMPVAVWSLRNGELTNVTSGFRRAVRQDAARWRRMWRQRRRDPSSRSLGPLAAWAANEYRLGHRAQVRRELRVALRRGWLRGIEGWPRGKRFISELDRFLKRTGYHMR